MVRWQRRKSAARAAEFAEDVEDQAQEVIEALIEGVAKEKEIAETIHAAAVSPERAPESQLSVSTGEWHVPEIPGDGLAEGLDPFAGIVSAITTGLGLAVMRGGLKARSERKRQELLLQCFADRSICVDPAVSFAPNSCCLLVAQPGGGFTVQPCADASTHDHPGMLMMPPIARSWARQLHDLPDLALTPEQTAAITAWIRRAGDRGPKVIVISAPESPADAPRQDARSDQPGQSYHSTE
jgi:hypothetical protein